MKTMNGAISHEFGIGELCLVVLKKIKIISVVALGFAICIFLFCNYVMEWKYEATTRIYVLSNQRKEEMVTYSDLQTSTQLIKDYMMLMTSRLVTEQVMRDLNLNLSHEELLRRIRVENPSETRIINITVNYKSPRIAKQIADAIRDKSLVLITEVTGQELSGPIEKANLPEEPSSPNLIKNTILGGAIGIVVCTFICLLRYILDTTIRTHQNVEQYLGVRFLTTIPVEEKKKVKAKKQIQKSKKQKSNKQISKKTKSRSKPKKSEENTELQKPI